ncbi:PadR family transcriptional regulator [Streptomyces sp. NBC_00120]|uniref:PadR family transcriptional regulator n=1 Tax=unclassified Streptomyces TaxID=2593676 RepID=UPI002253A811|nr:PadR family transcriptional regulator [Streptomyces sp. NBC_00120]MCX5322841.1 PadR family transcriptional regulator [Streptomyces sp. NBC_00120]
MKFEYVLLALLSYRPFSGYDLRKWVDTEGQFLRSRAHHSQIYRLLGRMVDDGWVAYEVDPREGRPDAKVYRLTPRGRDVLMEWVRSPYDPPSRFQDADFLARFSFAAPLDKDAAIRLIRTELTYRRAQIAGNRDRDRHIAFENPLPELDQDLAREISDELHAYGASSVDRWVSWLEGLLRRLETGRRESEGFTPPKQQTGDAA